MSTDKVVAPPLPEAVREQIEQLIPVLHHVKGIKHTQTLDDFYRMHLTALWEAAAQQERARLSASLPELRGWDVAERVTDWPAGFCEGEADYQKRVEAWLACPPAAGTGGGEMSDMSKACVCVGRSGREDS